MSYSFANNRSTSFVNDGLELAFIHTFLSKDQKNGLVSKINKDNTQENRKELTQIAKIPAAGDNFYLLKLKLIVDRLDILINSKEITKKDIQFELNKIIVEIQELSKMNTTERYLDVANQYKQIIADKLKILETKIHQ
jgi:hypothetical protein